MDNNPPTVREQHSQDLLRRTALVGTTAAVEPGAGRGCPWDFLLVRVAHVSGARITGCWTSGSRVWMGQIKKKEGRSANSFAVIV